MNKILNSIERICNEIKSRDCYEKLKKIEERIEKDDEVIFLASSFNKAQLNYSDGLKHYEDGSIELQELFDEVKKTKMELDSNPLVEEYYRIFSEVNEPLNYIQFKLISLFGKKSNHSCE